MDGTKTDIIILLFLVMFCLVISYFISVVLFKLGNFIHTLV